MKTINDENSTNIQYRKFRIVDLFDIIKGKRLTRESQTTGNTPFIGSTENNNGITAYIGQEPICKENAITISYNGSVGQVFYQEKPFWASDDINVLYLKGKKLNPLLFCYLGACLKRSGKAFSYTRKWNLERMKSSNIVLPICLNNDGTPTIDPDHTYHPDGYIPDWDYMQEHIWKLEEERNRELEQYLIATGLIDYELTKEEINIIKNTEVPIRKDFSFDYLFKAETGNVDLQQKDINGKGCYFINSGLENYGIKGKTDRPAKVFPKNTITIDFWGNAFYRPFEYKLATHNHVFSLSGDVIKNELIGLYLVSQMIYLRNLFSYAEMGTWNKIKVLNLSLPIKIGKEKTPVFDDNHKFHKDGYIPDFDYMEKYIRIIQKKVIADVVKYKDEIIASTKNVLSK